MTAITLEPKQSQELYDFVINERSKLPPTYDYGDAVLTKDQLLKIYDIVATNRAKSRGTKLYFESSDDGDVTNIEYDEIKIRPQEIVTPRRKNCMDAVKSLRTFYPNVLTAERRIKDKHYQKHHPAGPCQDQLKAIDSDSIDCMVTDPPYGYSFMNKDWDKAVVGVDTWKECLRVLKPGAFAFIMSSPRQDVFVQNDTKLNRGRL